jgi:hypothetical protein
VQQWACVQGRRRCFILAVLRTRATRPSGSGCAVRVCFVSVVCLLRLVVFKI